VLYLWLKAGHIAFMVTWFAGLFYLPRLFIYHAEAADPPSLVVYHFRCRRWVQRLAAGERPGNTRWLRWFNEIPVVFLLGIVGLAVLKPA